MNWKLDRSISMLKFLNLITVLWSWDYLCYCKIHIEVQWGHRARGPQATIKILKIFVCREKWRRQSHPTPVLLPGKPYGWRSLVDCSPCGCWGSDTTKRLHFHFSLSCIGEGNGNPLQCSCLENSRDGGAWWAAAYGVAQSRTRLKWLSSSREKNKANMSKY